MRPIDRHGVLQRGALLCGGLLLAMAAQASGGVFKWVDRNGITRYDDQSLLAERMTRATIARGSVAADARATVPSELVTEVARQCSDFKELSASYAEARDVYGRDPVGNQYRFSPNQVALEVARLNEKSRRYCRPLAAQHLLEEAREEQRREEVLRTAQSAQ